MNNFQQHQHNTVLIVQILNAVQISYYSRNLGIIFFQDSFRSFSRDCLRNSFRSSLRSFFQDSFRNFFRDYFVPSFEVPLRAPPVNLQKTSPGILPRTISGILKGITSDFTSTTLSGNSFDVFPCRPIFNVRY